ncbi:MAG: CapA family protein, partial [Bacillota bacterium]
DRQTFNAPDELAASLLSAGFDVATTANNHCLDRGADGMARTAEVLRAAGLTQLGTYVSQEDRLTARVVDVNGIRVGLLAWTFSVNGNEDMLSSGQRGYAVGRTGDKARMQEDIRLCKEAGAEFLVAFAHWDTEFSEAPDSSTRRLAKWMLEQGVDAVIGSHPHVVQPAEFITVQRGEEEYTGLVIYSLGNCLSNMAPSPRDYGLYVQLTLTKRPDGAVELSDAGLLPLYCCKHRVEGRTLHEVLPAEEDATAVAAEFGADPGDLMKARAHVLAVCGGAVKPLHMEYQAEIQAKGEPYEG